VAVKRPVFLDTSVLLAGLTDIAGEDHPAQELMDAIAGGRLGRPHTAWHCCLEFYSVTTRLPEEWRLQPADALRLISVEVMGRLEVHQLPPGALLRFLGEAASERVAGGRIYDFHIAAIARQVGARTVVTENARHFAALGRHGIRVASAEEFAAAELGS
jgi:predicted nucleic acid-binding protein